MTISLGMALSELVSVRRSRQWRDRLGGEIPRAAFAKPCFRAVSGLYCFCPRSVRLQLDDPTEQVTVLRYSSSADHGGHGNGFDDEDVAYNLF
jgi:hypothetical protein